jgi:hypothetical protein
MYTLFWVLLVILGAANKYYIYLLVSVCFLFGLLCVYNITIEIDNTHFSFKLGIGLIKKRYEIANIKSCKPYSGISKRFGIGSKVSFFTGRKLEYYIVTGYKAVELQFFDRPSTIVLIGTNSPEEISQYVQLLIEKNKLDNICV